MAKGLGQIHTCNFEVEPIDSNGEKWLLDTAGVLSNQLNHMVRQGNYMKIVGIDMTVSEQGGNDGGGQVTGYLSYYAPTRGRCEAFKSAFAAVREGARIQGIRLTDNQNYDFRVPIRSRGGYQNASDIKNVATINGLDELSLYDAADPGASIFDVYNSNIQPAQSGSGAPTFSSGYGVPGSGGTVGTDFVLNEGTIFDPAMHNVASTNLERIPFQLTFTPHSTDMALNFQWRPDPALYLAVLTGQFELVIDEMELDGAATDLKIECAIHVAGWKSIMGNPDKKRRKGTRHRKSHSSKRRS